jgi:hypothetical protein
VETKELSAHLRAATMAVEPRPGFAEAVATGGRRRQVRRRLGLATAAAVAVTLAATTYTVLDNTSTPDVMAGWLDGPTKGDLAGDQPFLDKAVRLWDTGKAVSPNRSTGVFDDLRSEPRVYWAGDTPSGAAAVVVQQAYLHPHEELPAGAANTIQTLVGLVATDPADRTLKLVGDQFRTAPTAALPGYFWFGANDLTLLVVDPGYPVWESHTAGEDLRPIPMRGGVAVVRYEGNTRPAALVGGPEPPADTRVEMPPYLASEYVAAKQRHSGPLLPAGTPVLGWGENWVVGPDIGFTVDHPLALLRRSVLDTPAIRDARIDNWTITTQYPGGFAMVVGALKHGAGPWNLLMVIVDKQQKAASMHIAYSSVNPNKPAPVTLEVSYDDGRAWLVAAKGKRLRYRVGGDWVDAGTSVAIVPWEASRLRVGDKEQALR